MKRASTSCVGPPVVERRDQRLHHRDGAVVGARVSPSSRGRAPRAGSSGSTSTSRRGRANAQTDSATLARRSWNLRSAGAVKTGFDPRMTSSSTWPASIAVDEIAQRRDLVHRVDFDRRRVGDRRPDVAERLVQLVRQVVHRRGLVLAGDDERAAAVRLQILGDGGEELLRARRSRTAAGTSRRARARRLRSRTRLQRQAVIRLRARERRRALDRVQPVHRLRARSAAAPRGRRPRPRGGARRSRARSGRSRRRTRGSRSRA